MNNKRLVCVACVPPADTLPEALCSLFLFLSYRYRRYIGGFVRGNTY